MVVIEADESADPAVRPQLVVTPAGAVLAPPPPPGPGAATNLTAVADAYVRDGGYASTNYGTAAQLQLKQTSSAGWSRESALRFDVSMLGAVSSAKLRLFGKLDNTQAASVGVQAYASADTSWSEAGVTWNTRPRIGATPVAWAP
jgi:hypothetical protein